MNDNNLKPKKNHEHWTSIFLNNKIIYVTLEGVFFITSVEH